jgi:hypothetical protein
MNSHTYIVRVWSEFNTGGSSVWRASLLDTTNRERLYFSSANLLAEFLVEVSDAKPALPLEPTESR